MSCEYCGRKLRADEAKGCRLCAGALQRLMKEAAESHYQAHQESHGHLSGNPNDHQAL